jgi:protein TonB
MRGMVPAEDRRNDRRFTDGAQHGEMRFLYLLAALAACLSLQLPDAAAQPDAKAKKKSTVKAKAKGKSPPAKPAAVAVSSAQTLDAYKEEVARLIYKANAGRTFAEPARPLLKGVIVMSVTIGADGKARASVLRSNGKRELDKLAIASVARTGQLPRWKDAAGGEVRYMETWLFREDNRFQIRSIAPVQLTG